MTGIPTDEIDELLRLAPLAEKSWNGFPGAVWNTEIKADFIDAARNAIPAIKAMRERLSVESNVQEIHRDYGKYDVPPRGRFQDTPVEADVAAMVKRLQQASWETRPSRCFPSMGAWVSETCARAADMLTRLSLQSAAGAEVLAERESCAKIADHEVNEFERLAIAAGEANPQQRALHASCLSVALGIAAAIRARPAQSVAAGEEG